MEPLYTQEEFNNSGSCDKLPCKCQFCKSTFYAEKRTIKQEIKQKRGRVLYCSQACFHNNSKTKQVVNCANCGISFKKKPSEIKKSKSGNHFCSKSCAAFYRNKNKTHGIRRSKLEIWLEKQLLNLYPDLKFHFNRKDTIGSELDIYIPKLSLAFELNGIFHYEPIFGKHKLKKIQENDRSKSKACIDAEIDLCIMDVSFQKYFKEKSSKKYLSIITNIIDEKII